MSEGISLGWAVEGQNDGERSFRIAVAIWRLADDLIREQIPDLQEMFHFDRSFFFQTHFDDAGWFAIRIYSRRDGGITTGPNMDESDITYLKAAITKSGYSHQELKSMLRPDWLSHERFTYIGPHKNGTVSWDAITTHVLEWFNNCALPKALDRNRDRILRAIPTAPLLDLASITRAMWVLECDTEMLQGTAFALADVGIVTCTHVLGPNSYAFRYDSPQTKFNVKILRSHEVIDLAIVQIDTDVLPLKRGDPNNLKQLDHLVVVGHPNFRPGDSPAIAPGLLIGWRTRSGIRRLMTNAPIVRGGSGGPVLDQRGMVIGVAATGADNYRNATVTEDHSIIPIDALDLF